MNIRGLKILEFPKVVAKFEAKAQTAIGKEQCQNLIPINDLALVQQMQQETREGMDVLRLKGGFSLGGIRDIRSYLKRINLGGELTAEQLLEISGTIYGSRNVKKFITKINEDNPLPILYSHVEAIKDLKDVEDRINSCINEYGEVVDSASSELRTIRNQIRTLEGRVKEKLGQIIRNSNYQKALQDKIITIRNGRYAIPVKQEYRTLFGGIIHDQSASGATLFIEPEAIVQINNLLKEQLLKEEREIERILRNLSNEVREESEALSIIVEHLGVIDFIQAKAELAKDMKAVQPKLNDKGFLNIKKARHPLIAANEVVPIDVHLGNEFTSIVITGPNTGGKTVTLKTIGLLTLMAMAGLHVPVEEESELAVFSSVYADIGDEQSIEQSLSTFSGHLKNIVRILEEMDNNSLILLDELGAGTDPTEGAALAISILEKIRAIGTRVVATTHYSELKAYAYNQKNVVNASVEFDIETLRPTYRLLIGVPGRSNAFNIAQRLGLSEDIINFARGQISEDNLQVESMIASLETNRRNAEKEQVEAKAIRKKAEQINKELEMKIETFENQKLKLYEDAKKNAEEIVVKAKKEAEDVIAELRKFAMDEQAGIKEHRLIEMKKRLEESIPDIKTKAPKRSKKQEKIEAGDEVKVLSIGQKGIVVEQVDDKEFIIQIGILKMKAEMSDLEIIRQNNEATKKINITSIKRESTVRNELDVRGQNVEEAIMSIDRYLDEAFMEGYGQVSIIHGKGTGALRTGLQNFLRKHPHVTKTRIGQFGEGGSGVTIVELK